jgi:uncharacterized damage-inducible protein DinB
MTSREFFLETLADEKPRFERALRAVPEDGMAYRPHERSRSTAELLAVFADETAMLESLIRTGELDMSGFAAGAHTRAGDVADAVARNFDAARAVAAAVSDADWDGPARLMSGDKVEWETTRGKMAWGFLLDLIHHRGQLTVYLRPMGARVPPVYGPSADENG